MDWVLAHHADILLVVTVCSGLVTVVGFFVHVVPKHPVTQRAAVLLLAVIALGSAGYVFLVPVTAPAGPETSRGVPPDLGNEHPASQFDSAVTTPAAMPVGQADVRANVSPTEPTPIPVALTIAGNASNGVRYSVPRDGVYRITVTGGAYSPWTDDGTRQGQWRTLLDVYLDNASWAVTSYSSGPKDYTPSVAARIGFVGCDTDWNDKATATACGLRSTPLQRPLNAGQGLVLMPIDSEGEYVGNREQVYVLIAYVGP